MTIKRVSSNFTVALFKWSLKVCHPLKYFGIGKHLIVDITDNHAKRHALIVQ